MKLLSVPVKYIRNELDIAIGSRNCNTDVIIRLFQLSNLGTINGRWRFSRASVFGEDELRQIAQKQVSRALNSCSSRSFVIS